MLRQLAISGVVVFVLAIAHFTVLAILFQRLRAYQPDWSNLPLAPVPILLAAFGGVLAVHAAEIWLFAALYLLIGALPNFETSLYFSAVSYSSIGYGDILLGKDWRILGAIEGTVGIILLGCSTAFIVAVVTELELFEKGPPHPRKKRSQ